MHIGNMIYAILSPLFVITLDVLGPRGSVHPTTWTVIEGASTHLCSEDPRLPNGIDVMS